MLAPFTPFMANEIHEDLTGEPAEEAAWPTVDETFVDPAVEAAESLVEDLTEDVRDIVDVTGTDPDVVRLYVAADWKHTVFETVLETGTNVGDVMSEVMSDPDLRERGNEVNDLVQELVELVRDGDRDTLAAVGDVDEATVYEDAADFLGHEYDAEIEVYAEDGEDVVDPGGKSGQAVPFRPAIHIE